MKCKSCSGDVPPKFSHAILVNICPLCGDPIMDDELQSALADLKSAMTATASYPNEIFDWLKSNYNLFTLDDVTAKLNEAEAKLKETYTQQIVKPIPKSAQPLPPPKEIQVDEDGNQLTGQVIQSPDQTSKFLKDPKVTRAISKQDHFKNVIKQIKSSGKMPESSGISGGGGGGALTPDMIEGIDGSEGGLDSEELAELNAAFGNDEPGIQSGLDDEMGFDDEIPLAVLNMANAAGGNVGSNNKDLKKLAALQGKSARASNAMRTGGSVGLIRR